LNKKTAEKENYLNYVYFEKNALLNETALDENFHKYCKNR